MEFLLLLIAIFSTLALVLLKNLWRTKLTSHIKKGREAPEPWGVWPIIGHLHLLVLGGQTPACRTLGAMADKHGPIFTIWLGMQRALVVSSWEGVKECFRDHDLVFLSRPLSAALKYMGYNGAFFAFTPYGPYWLAMRKIATHKILSNHQLELLKHVRASEVGIGIKDLYSLCINDKTCWALVDMGQWFDHVTMNTMAQMIAGKRYCGNDRESQRYGEAIKKFMYLSGVFVLSDVIPGFEWLDLQGHLRSMKRNAKDLDYFMSSWLEEHLEDRRDGKVKEDRDFMDVMLSLLADEESIYGHKRENIIKATALTFIIAGADATSVSLTWALSLVLNHTEVLKHAQDELDIHVGRERWVEESDFKNLIYLQSIVKETLRLYPPGPLSIPREAMENCYIAGYYVPKGTRLIVNIWKLHHDPRVWPNPFEFQPERFLTSHAKYDVRGQHLEYIPFSSGRRSCPGVSSGFQMISLMLARILQGFNLSSPMNAPVNLSEGAGLTMPKARPLEVKLTPRLPRKLYEI